MNLKDIKKSYGLIVSLGSSCSPAAHLRRRNLRKFSMPLDWVVSNSLQDVNRLLENKFQGFMDLKNMRIIDGIANHYNEEKNVREINSYFVKDTDYNIISVHDFPVLPDREWHETYPSYRAKLNMRINRFLFEVTNSPSILFVRWAARYDEAIKLQAVLSKLKKNKFDILILQPVDDLKSVNEMNWGIDRVCCVNVPNKPNDNLIWDYVLTGVTLSK